MFHRDLLCTRETAWIIKYTVLLRIKVYDRTTFGNARLPAVSARLRTLLAFLGGARANGLPFGNVA